MYHSFDLRMVYGYSFPFWVGCILFHIWVFFVKLSYILSQFCYHGQNYENVLQPLWWRILTRPSVLVYQSYFYMLHPIRSGILKSLFFEVEGFWDNSKINSILVRQLKSLNKMVVSSAKLSIIISWSSFRIPLILVSASMKIASTSVTIMHNNIESRKPC